MARGWPQEACRNRRRAGLPELLRRDERWRRTPRLHPRLSKACFGVDAGPASGGGEMRVQWVRQSAAAPAAATAPGNAATPDPSFPAVDPAAQIRGVDRRGAVSGRVLLRPHASARETPASAALAAAASGAEVHPRPQELSPPRAGAGAGADARPALGHKKTKRKPKLDAIKIASPRILTFRPGCAELLSRNFQNCLYLLVGALPFEIAWNRDEPIEPSFLTDLS